MSTGTVSHVRSAVYHVFQATANGASFNNNAQLQVPMTLLTAKKPMPRYFTPNAMEAWLRMHEEFAKKIQGIQRIVTDRSTHMVPVEQPKLVVDAIRHEIESLKLAANPQVRT